MEIRSVARGASFVAGLHALRQSQLCDEFANRFSKQFGITTNFAVRFGDRKSDGVRVNIWTKNGELGVGRPIVNSMTTLRRRCWKLNAPPRWIQLDLHVLLRHIAQQSTYPTVRLAVSNSLTRRVLGQNAAVLVATGSLTPVSISLPALKFVWLEWLPL